MRELILVLALLTSSLAFSQDIPQTRLTPVQDDAGVLWLPLARVTQPVEEAARNAVILDFPVGDGTGNRGSGVYLGSKYVASAWHVPEGSQQRGTVTFRDGTRIGCTVNGRDTVWDQCVVILDSEHPSLPGVAIAEQDPRIGEEVYSVGFGQGFRIFGGQVTSYAGSTRGPGQNWFNHQSPAVSGDSGGPIFTQTGKLIGCLWGAGNGQTIGTRSTQFQVFVKPLFPHLAQWRANRIGRQIAGIALIQAPGPAQSQGDCFTGNCPQQRPPSQGIDYPQAPPSSVMPPTVDVPLVGPQCEPGPPGPAGPPGPKGQDGKDGQVTEEHLTSIVSAVVANLKSDPSMRGPKGDTGQVGPTGPTGPAGKDGQGITPEQLAKIKAELLAEIQHPNIRVVIGNGGRIVDDETYRPGEPIVLDIEALVRAANAK